MIDKILEISLRQRAFVLLAAFALLGVGLWSGSRLPIDAVPDITGVQAPELSAAIGDFWTAWRRDDSRGVAAFASRVADFAAAPVPNLAASASQFHFV